ncbi:MAG: tRNA pseudouridine(55) synthase TruB [Thermoleophilia bacterium]|nr:tRNA pseudouridine(55) synthase TruB [Thermoleophilia bacterium]
MGRGGVVLVDKEAGPSSFAVVRRVRARFGLKTGHGGTLDPFATGLLVCLVGRATRLARYQSDLDKRYLVSIRLGVRTTTGDAEGRELERTPTASREEIERLRGEVELRVPAASAVKIAGERAYRLHRRGVEVEMPFRRSVIHSLDVLVYEPPDVRLELRVSSGTYVRALADALGGHCTGLRRTAVGHLRVEDADEERLLPPLTAVEHLRRRELTDEENVLVRSGRALPDESAGRAALVHAGELVAVGSGDGRAIRPETVLA